MKRVLVIIGTRPEVIKLAPVIKELNKHADQFKLSICVTAQHRFMLDQMLSVFSIKPDLDLNLMKKNQSLSDFSSEAIKHLEWVINQIKPDIVLVQGDTSTAMVACLVAYYHKIYIGHIEAGLRTQNKYEPFPEEINRRLISVLADINFAPTEKAKTALLAEGVAAKSIIVTGNTVIDALVDTIKQIKRTAPQLPDNLLNELQGKRLILVTGHRRENFDKALKELCAALKVISANFKDTCIVYPVHLNPNVRVPVYQLLQKLERINLMNPLPYPTFVYLMKKSFLILTDSGGIQEEATFLGKPVLVVRNITERQEAVESGNALLVGIEKEKIVQSIKMLLNDSAIYKTMSIKRNIFGDGKATVRIVKALLKI